ncbi:MAG: glycosyltransferase family 9 protein [Puniceicoccales bacterium]|jgi:ADP-heptose:LPS heptosyltransferase|nr:glycosyltransferase family 9 protein [Puniceicoccales bacterium]
MDQRTKILIIKPSSLGDIIHGLQVAAIIKDCLPNVSIDWVVRDCFADIVRASSIAENIFPFHRGGGFRKFVKLILGIRKFHYDYVFDMQGLARTGIMTYFARAGKKIGRSDAREFAWLAYGKKIPLPEQPFPHAIDILLQFLPELGLEPKLRAKLKFAISPSPTVKNLPRIGEAADPPMILLFPESRRMEKRWPYFSKLAIMLAEKFPSFRTVIASTEFFSVGKNIPNVCNLSGRTSLTDAIHLVKKAALVIGNDSAPVHLAAAIGIPLVALFGPTDPKMFGPYPIGSESNHVIQSADKNLASIQPADVLSAATFFLQ